MTAGARLGMSVVGCGQAFLRLHLPALRRSPDWDLEAICDSSQQSRDRAALLVPGAQIYSTAEVLFSSVESDAVIVATPPETHRDLMRHALAAGLHVLVEKPAALEVEDAEAMLQAAETSDLVVVIGFNRRFRRPYRRLYRVLREGTATEFRAIRFQTHADMNEWAPMRIGDGSQDIARAVLHDVASHQLDLVTWLTATPVRRARVLSVDGRRGTDVCVSYELQLSDRLVARCEAAYARRYHEELYVETAQDLYVVHPGGLVSGRNQGRARKILERTGTLARLAFCKTTGRPNLTAESFDRQLAAFAEAIRGQSQSAGTSVASGWLTTRGLEACWKSFREGGKWIEL